MGTRQRGWGNTNLSLSFPAALHRQRERRLDLEREKTWDPTKKRRGSERRREGGEEEKDENGSIPGATLGPVLSDRNFRSSVRRSCRSLCSADAPLERICLKN